MIYRMSQSGNHAGPYRPPRPDWFGPPKEPTLKREPSSHELSLKRMLVVMFVVNTIMLGALILQSFGIFDQVKIFSGKVIQAFNEASKREKTSAVNEPSPSPSFDVVVPNPTPSDMPPAGPTPAPYFSIPPRCPVVSLPAPYHPVDEDEPGKYTPVCVPIYPYKFSEVEDPRPRPSTHQIEEIPRQSAESQGSWVDGIWYPW